MKTTVAEARDYMDWSTITNYCRTDPRLLAVWNSAIQRLMPKGKFVGTWRRYRICVASACLTWPRPLETIEGVWVCSRPLAMRNSWFEGYPHGYGLLSSESGGMDHIDRDDGYVQFYDISSTAKIALYSPNPSDNGKTVLLQGRDDSNRYIRTVGDTVDGESITLQSGYVISSSIFAPPGLVGVQKQATTSPVYAYAVVDTAPSGFVADISTLTPVPVAYWEPDETLPNYRRSLIPGLQNGSGGCQTCGDAPNTCSSSQVTVVAKLKFIKAVKDTDYLQIGNLPALEEEVQAVMKARRGMIEEAEAHEARAVRLLEEELSSYQGHGVTQGIKVDEDAYAASENYVADNWGGWSGW